MGLECGSNFLKYSLFVVNLVFFIVGTACVAIGLWLILSEGNAINDVFNALDKAGSKVDQNDRVENSKAFQDLGILMSVVGSLIVVISFLGCCGAVKEWRILLIAYGICLLVILIILVSVAIYAIVNRNSVNDKVKEAMENSMKYYGKVDGITSTWNSLMKRQKCCGVVSGNAVEEFSALNRTSTGLPESCCPPGKTKANKCPESKAYTTGCHNRVRAWFNDKMAIVIGVGAAVALFLIIGIVFAFCLCQKIGTSDD